MNKTWANTLFCILMFHFAMVLTSISPLLIEISRTYSLSMASSGWVFTLNFLGFVLLVFIGGALADVIGKKRVMFLSLAGMSLCLLLTVFASTYFIFCSIIFFIGGFGGVVEGVMSSTIPDVNETRMSFYQNLVQVFFGLGALAGPLAAGVLVSHGIDWRVVMALLGALGAVIAAALAFTRLPDRRSVERFSLSGAAGLTGDHKFLVVCLCVFLYTGSEVGSWGWMSTFLKSNLDFSLERASLAVGLFWITMTVGRFVCGQLSLVVKPPQIVTVLAYSSFAVNLSSLFIDSEVMTWVQIALMGLTFSSIWPLVVAYGAEHRRTPSGLDFAVLIGSGGIGAMVIPYLMGLVGSAFGTKIPMLLPCVSLLAVGVIFTVFVRSKFRAAEST